MRFVALGEIEWGDLDWGNVPEWLAGLGSLSLVLAFLVFKRDRDNSERVQVDRLGVWATVNPERTPNSLDSQEIHEVTTWVRNGSELPVRVVKIGLLIYTRWTVNNPELHTWTVEPGIKPVPAFIGDLHVPPGETEEYKLAVSVADTAPEEAQITGSPQGRHCAR